MSNAQHVATKEDTAAIERRRAADFASEPGPQTPLRRGVHAQWLDCQKTVGNRTVQRMIGAGLASPPGARPVVVQRAGAPVMNEEGSPGTNRDTAADVAPPLALARHIAPVGKPANGPRIQAHWYNIDIPFTDYQFDPSIEGIKTAAGVVKDAAVDAFDWIVDQIKGLVSAGIEWLENEWDSIQKFVSSMWDSAKNVFSNIVRFVKNPLGFLADALMSFDADSLRRAWSVFSGLITTLGNGFKTMVDGVMGRIGKVWNTIDGYATSLLSRLMGMTDNFVFRKLPDALQKVAFSVINTLKGVWKKIEDGWNNVFGKVKAWVDGAIDAVMGFVRKVLAFGIEVVITGIIQFGQIVLFLKDLFSNPRKYVDLLAKRGVEAFDGVESRFAGVIAQHLGGPVPAAPAATTQVQRSPGPETKRSASWGEIGHGIGQMMGKKWEEFKSNPMAVVTGLLMDMIFPIVGNIKDVIQLFKDIKKIVTGPLSAGSLEELWTSLLQILEIPILIYHTVVSILMRTLMLPLIVATFIPHPIVKGIAAAVGYALLGAFVQAELMNLGQKVLLLKTGSTNATQKEEAYNRIADSLIAMAMTAVIIVIMLILHFIANVMKGVYNFVKGRVFGIEPGAVEARGGGPGETKPVEESKGGESKSGDETLPDAESKKGVAAERTTADGHKIKIMEDGRIYLCTLCEEIDVRYRHELEIESPEIEAIKEKLETARAMENGPAKAEAVEQVKNELDAVRNKVRTGEPLRAKADALEKASIDAKGSIEEAKNTLDTKEARSLGADETLKPQLNKLRGDAGALDREWASAKPDADSAASSAKDPGVAADAETAKESAKETDALRDRMENIQNDAERVKRDVNKLIDEHTELPQAAITIEPDVPVIKQLEGTGQLRDLRHSPNLKGVNLEELLAKTPQELDAMRDAGTLDRGIHRQIMKTFEGRDLGGRGSR